jgi:hypothetical protein
MGSDDWTRRDDTPPDVTGSYPFQADRARTRDDFATQVREIQTDNQWKE